MNNRVWSGKAVIFDLDGTLIDTYQLILSSMRHATKTVLDRDFSDAELMENVGRPLEYQLGEFADSSDVAEKLVSTYRAHNENVHDQMVRAFEGVPEVLESLRSIGYALGVVTSKRHVLAQRGLDVCGLASYMDFLIGPDDCSAHKPDPGGVLLGCTRACALPEQCAYVGDSPFDMQAANRAGCFSVAALWGMFDEEILQEQHPCAVCYKPKDLLGLFSKSKI